MYANNDSMVIGIDIGGTKIAGGLFNHNGDLLYQAAELVAYKTGNEVVRVLIGIIDELQKTALSKSSVVCGIGMAVPGRVDSESGIVWAPNIDGWTNIDLLNLLAKTIDFNDGPIIIDSDRSCYILGEQWKGNANGFNDAIYLAVGTGIGAGILSNGQLIKGHSGTAGAMGWMALDKPYIDDYNQCGCFEYHASGSGLAALYHKYVKQSKSIETDQSETPSFSTHEVFSAYNNGDPLAVKIMNNAIGFWGMATANLVSLFNPQIIIFGGGIFGPALSLLDDIRLEAEKWAQPLAIKQVKMAGSALEGLAGLYGAARLIINNPGR